MDIPTVDDTLKHPTWTFSGTAAPTRDHLEPSQVILELCQLPSLHAQPHSPAHLGASEVPIVPFHLQPYPRQCR